MSARPSSAGADLSTPAIHLFPPASRLLLALDARQCRWPVGELADPGFCFCAARRAVGSAYCAFHRALACESSR